MIQAMFLNQTRLGSLRVRALFGSPYDRDHNMKGSVLEPLLMETSTSCLDTLHRVPRRARKKAYKGGNLRLQPFLSRQNMGYMRSILWFL